jgi:hypothetical protein
MESGTSVLEFRKSTLQFDWLDNQNLSRTFRLTELSREKVSPTLETVNDRRKTIPAGNHLFACRVCDTIETSKVRSLRESLPSEEDNVELQLPVRLVARDLTGLYKKLKPEDLNNIPAKIRYDMESSHLRFFVLDAGFGVMPEPKRKVDWVSLKIELAPQSKQDEFLRIYELAPQTAYQVTSSFEGNVDINTDLKFSTPEVVPWLNAGAGVKGQFLWKTSLKFAKSTITSSTNQNYVLSWQFQSSGATGEDPRGLFQTAAILGVPQSYGNTVRDLSEAISAAYTVKASIKRWVYSNFRENDRKMGIDFQTMQS